MVGRMKGVPDSLLPLVEAALAVRGRAHAPWSGFNVGAAVRAPSGRIHAGANVEVSSYGLTLCAERVAISTAVVAGDRDFDAIAVVVDTDRVAGPCGACRQFLVDFAPDAVVVLVPLRADPVTTTVRELMPLAFGPADLQGFHTRLLGGDS